MHSMGVHDLHQSVAQLKIRLNVIQAWFHIMLQGICNLL